jgi:pyruvate/2-oxoglutarate dehydrogenase complex dihydrolipoamide acyltransferase (E2) component
MATLSVTIPALGRDGLSVRLVRWSKAVGDHVRADEPLGFLQIGTEVFLAEIPSPGSGVLTALHAFPGDPIRAGQVVGHVHTETHEAVRAEAEIVAAHPHPPATSIDTRQAVAVHEAAIGGTLAGSWQALAMAAVGVASVLMTNRRPDEPVLALLAGLGLAYFALPAWASYARRSGPAPAWDLSAPRHGRLWTVFTFIAAISLPAGLALTEPLTSWLAREGRTSADVLKDVLPAMVAVVGCSFFAVRQLKPRGPAIVGLAAIGAALIVVSSTRTLTGETLLMLAAFVAWPVLTFAEHDRHVQTQHERGADAPVASPTLPIAPPASTAKGTPLLVQHVR